MSISCILLLSDIECGIIKLFALCSELKFTYKFYYRIDLAEYTSIINY